MLTSVVNKVLINLLDTVLRNKDTTLTKTQGPCSQEAYTLQGGINNKQINKHKSIR